MQSNVSFHNQLLKLGPTENLDFWAFRDLENHGRTVSQIIFFFGTAPVSQYVVNEGADNKLNSVDSVLVDIENVVIMWWAL